MKIVENFDGSQMAANEDQSYKMFSSFWKVTKIFPAFVMCGSNMNSINKHYNFVRQYVRKNV